MSHPMGRHAGDVEARHVEVVVVVEVAVDVVSEEGHGINK